MADFNVNGGYSYIDLVKYLNLYKEFYWTLYRENENSRNLVKSKDNEIEKISHKIKQLEKMIEDQNFQINNLKSYFGRKLTIWERITGKMKN